MTNKPITRIINTHTHGDHTGSNEFFGASIETIVQENTKANMAKMDEFKGDKAQFLPKKTYKDKLTVGSGKDEIDLYYFGRGHTNGDTFVVFPALRTMHVGECSRGRRCPMSMPANGGSVIEQPKTLGEGASRPSRTWTRSSTATSRVDLERSAGVRSSSLTEFAGVCREGNEGGQDSRTGRRRSTSSIRSTRATS